MTSFGGKILPQRQLLIARSHVALSDSLGRNTLLPEAEGPSLSLPKVASGIRRRRRGNVVGTDRVASKYADGRWATERPREKVGVVAQHV
jgi:hypothetical protein